MRLRASLLFDGGAAAPSPLQAAADSAATASAIPAPAPRPASRQQVGFAEPFVTVSQRAHSAVLSLVRQNGSSGRTRIFWRTIDGSAKSGTDYEGVGAGTAEFADNESRRVLYIGLKGNERPGSRNFFVELRSAKGGAQVSGITRIPVTIVDY